MCLHAKAVLFTLVSLTMAVASKADDCNQVPPVEILARSASAFRALGSFRGTLSLTVSQPGQEPVQRAIQYGAGPDGVFVDAGFQRIVAANGRIRVTQVDIEDKYVSAPFDGDFSAALSVIGGEELQIPNLPPIVLYQTKEDSTWIDSFRLRTLDRLSLAAHTSMVSEAGQGQCEIEMTAENGMVRARFDTEGGLLVGLELEATPAGAPASMRLRVSVQFTTEPLDSLGTLLAVDTSNRAAVPDLAALTSEAIELGAEVPKLALESIRGERVNLRDLRGKVVVLDFWASWCGPCWKALAGLEKLAVWAQHSTLPVVVWPVNTTEDLGDEAAKREKLSRLWQERGFRMDSLIDTGNALFASIGAPGLPVTVVIAPDGTVAFVHLGVLADPQATLQAEVQELVTSER